MTKIGETLHIFFNKILGSVEGWQKEKPCAIEIQSGRAFKLFSDNYLPSLVEAVAEDSLTYVSHAAFSGAGRSPLIMAKNDSCRRLVMCPRLPSPTVILSTERIGVISAAVPVKKSSSQM